MKTTTTITITAGLACLAFSACGTNDPEYKAWKEQQAAQSSGNQYGVPQAGGESGVYTPSGAAPYQPLPGVNPAPSPQPPLGSDPATAAAPAAPTGPTTAHKVVAGDSLWALAKKYGTSVESIQAANGMNDNTIRIGQTLNIPSGQ
ncbi:LysM peptidoglycan-binding domain-containing protein [Verrucomicrobiaceae bacterium N1E253]|uniref:LysM peptidoglycan-binding domain-containing protein n=1 Tax=Oceaniferula marina TaxID=2748318 RepID=A0A851G9E6_9BACT|nr:LysM peptidoglycan-binding domain-containing protein [Oceaniferula marina]NWK54046.1 LysM peptidoglycan-binding domain-containing protein [Oceaniferula marina]